MTFSSSMNEVIVTISVSGRSALMRPMAVMPSMFGISRSISTTSGSSRRAIATPSEPSAASPTTSMSACRSKNILRPIRTTEWSSTMSTRIGGLSVTSAPGAAWAPLTGRARRGASSSLAKDRRSALGLRRRRDASRAGGRRQDRGDQLGRVGRSCARSRRRRCRSTSASSVSDQPMARMRTPAAAARGGCAMNAMPPSTSGSRGSTMTTSGW